MPYLQGQEKCIGPDHLNTLTTRHCLGMVLDKLGDASARHFVHKRCLTQVRWPGVVPQPNLQLSFNISLLVL